MHVAPQAVTSEDLSKSEPTIAGGSGVSPCWKKYLAALHPEEVGDRFMQHIEKYSESDVLAIIKHWHDFNPPNMPEKLK
jgi:hypothetical protein